MIKIMKEELLKTLKFFENKWVALVNDTVIASGETVAEVKQKADQTGQKEYVFYFVPSSQASFAPITLWG